MQGQEQGHDHAQGKSKPPGRPQGRINLRRMLFALPSIITLSSVFCGFDAIRVASSAQEPGDFYRAAILIIFAAVFDTLDGRVARMTRTQSAIGLQLDSLADVISFGVAPAVLMYHWSLKQLDTLGLVVAFLYVAAGAIRLARFNVLAMNSTGDSERSGKYFLGLPIPAAAGVIVALVFASQSGRFQLASHVWPMVAVTLCLGALMVSNLRFRSFKRIGFRVPVLLTVMLFVTSTAVVGLRLGASFILFWIAVVYLSAGIIESAIVLPKRWRAGAKSVPPP